MCISMVLGHAHESTTQTASRSVHPFLQGTRAPITHSKRLRVVGRISCCACHTMRSNNCLACIYTRQNTCLNGCRSLSIGIHTTTHLRRSYPRITVLTLSAAELWSSGADGKYRLLQTCCTSLLLTGYGSTSQTDRRTPLHRRLPRQKSTKQ